MKTVRGARLSIKLHVECPGCERYIDLYNADHTAGENLDDEGELSKWARGNRADFLEDFETTVTCSRCKTEFKVEGIEY